MTPPNSTDDIDKILIDFGMNCYEAAKNIKDATPKDLKTYKAKEAIQAEVQRQFLLGKLEAYKNVVSWEESYGGSPVLSALEAHKTAVRDIEQQLEALQQGD